MLSRIPKYPVPESSVRIMEKSGVSQEVLCIHGQEFSIPIYGESLTSAARCSAHVSSVSMCLKTAFL